jgi:alpha-D-ribose 1-methylphosphonate 5-triphosphate synthase subunit PhnI
MLLLPSLIFKGVKKTTFLISMTDNINIQYINISLKFPRYIEYRDELASLVQDTGLL